MAALDRVAGPSDDGLRVDVLVADWLSEPRGRVQQLVADGLVTVDGRPVAKSYRVAFGDHIVVVAPAPLPPTAPPGPVPVRYDDDDLAVVSKPAGLVVHSGAGVSGHETLVAALQGMGMVLAAGDDPQRPGIVHRLDRGTSGLLVVAKSAAARIGLVDIFKRHAVDRRYWALVDGVPDPPNATIDAPIARSSGNRTKFTVSSDGRRAVSHYDVVERLGHAAVVAVRLETGRTHQVRVHMAAVGHPVVSDRTYGASAALAEQAGLTRPALHAAHLGFDHPVTGERVAVDEPLPPDLQAAHAALRGG
jgi:23S rRNA pseudouridine1911/1915/1917 synthase